jgi:hypothetical protein
MQAEHGEEERKTAELLERGYLTTASKNGTLRKPKPCPRCGVLVERIGGCAHAMCRCLGCPLYLVVSVA